MPHTHHSHSGSFCNHAVDSLESIVDHAFARGMTTVSLTEHVPRSDNQLYPGELETGWDVAHQSKIFEAFLGKAVSLRTKVESQAAAVDASPAEQERRVLVGFESEWIDSEPDMAASRIKQVLNQHSSKLDFWIGSVHHVHGEPIDFDAAGYARAVQACGCDEDDLFAAYFNAQYQLLTTLHPPVVGHFDLIRLLSHSPDLDWRDRADGKLWKLIERNLRAVKDYEGVLEINTSALRKGLRQPYPRREILDLWHNQLRGSVVLSDDSHGTQQIGTCYEQILAVLEQVGIKELGVMRRKGLAMELVSTEVLKSHRFWTAT